MSIRYTIRHNIPSEKITAEDANDSSTWDLDLIRKHELAETTDHDIVYRQHDGRIVNWTEGATQRAALILQEVYDAKSDIEEFVGLAGEDLQDIRGILSDSREILETAQTVSGQAMQARTDCEEAEQSAKNYAEQAEDVATEANQISQQAINLITEHEHDLMFISNFRIVNGHLYQVMEG